MKSSPNDAPAKTHLPHGAVHVPADPDDEAPPSLVLRWTLASFHTVLTLYLLMNAIGLVIYQEIAGNLAVFIETNYTDVNRFPGEAVSTEAEAAKKERGRYARFAWFHRGFALLALLAAAGLGFQTYFLCVGEWGLTGLTRFLALAGTLLAGNALLGWEMARGTTFAALALGELVCLRFGKVRNAL